MVRKGVREKGHTHIGRLPLRINPIRPRGTFQGGEALGAKVTLVTALSCSSCPESGRLLVILTEELFQSVVKAQAIRVSLLYYQRHMAAVSRHLATGRPSLYRKLKELGLHDEAA